jgi:hypothetical protein
MKDYNSKSTSVAYVIGLNVNWLPISSKTIFCNVIGFGIKKQFNIQYFSQIIGLLQV